MEGLHCDKLFRILYQVREHPQLLFGVKSLLALENYLHGYELACMEHDRDCFTLRWLDRFYTFVSRACGVKEECFSLRSAIVGMGYDDVTGVDYFMELLEAFSQGVGEQLSAPKALRDGELRVFRVDALKAEELLSHFVREHCAELFCVPTDAEDYTFLFHRERDGSLTCAVCSSGLESVLSQEDSEAATAVRALPVFGAAERIQYTSILY